MLKPALALLAILVAAPTALRADTYNFMAAAGPDFKPGFVDTARRPNVANN